jgi:hypothetical protein
VFVCFGFSHAIRAVTPAPDGGYSNFNTAEGDNARSSASQPAAATQPTVTAVKNAELNLGYTKVIAPIDGSALSSNTSGSSNTANGGDALLNNTTGSNNTAEGFQALKNSTGSNNIALGSNAGINLTSGSNNIDIGASGVVGESNTIRIGKGGVQKTAYMQGIRGQLLHQV